MFVSNVWYDYITSLFIKLKNVELCLLVHLLRLHLSQRVTLTPLHLLPRVYPYTLRVKLGSVLKKPWLNFSSLPELQHLLADLEAFLISKNWKKC